MRALKDDAPRDLPLSAFRDKACRHLERKLKTEHKVEAAINAQKKEADGIVMDSSSWVISGKNPA